ncbi:serine hydrolase [Paenibacillus filicis]|uniref:Serine hydrolase n=1 Tax=Paenibacillus gyeongsangnamensis TaxID=3388067 RepID=A0ABT4QLC8_9BACL|nr:serine hydrolase domain-containing protein [Paenibacillus filicis]MCZ8517678.1 serine hydrolase [Paenibacillus filicis]
MLLPQELGNRFDQLIQYSQEINRRNQGSATAIVVIHQDKIVAEHYSGHHSQLAGAREVQPDSQFYIASARKSYIGLTAALAIYEGKLRLDDKVTALLDNYHTDLLEGTTIRHLLTYSYGLRTDDHGGLYRDFKAGSGWAYNNNGIQILEEIIQLVMEQSVEQIIQERICGPLDFRETTWRRADHETLVRVIHDPAGPPESRLGHLFVSARELAFWGYLHLKRGFINGKQVIPSQAIDLSTAVQSPSFDDAELPQNGFLWYVKRREARQSEIGRAVPCGSYQIVGVTGPLLLVVPELDLVVVRMYNKLYNYGDSNNDYLFYLREFGDKVIHSAQSQTS